MALKANKLASAKTIADLKAYKFGAQAGTTSLDTINNVIAPTAAAKVYSSNDDAIAGLKAKQIDGLVVDLPTAFYVTAAQVDNSVIVGQFAPPTGTDAEHFSVVLAKGSALTACVNAAIAALKIGPAARTSCAAGPISRTRFIACRRSRRRAPTC